MTNRGQLYTLEGIFAGLIILLGLFFAIQATTTSPSAAGASNPHATQDDKVYVEDVLQSMNHSTLEEATLYWRADGFHCTQSDREYYTGFWVDDPPCDGLTSGYDPSHPPPNTLGRVLEQRFGDQYSYNVRLAYRDGGSIEYQRMVYQGEPGVGAVSATTSVVLLNDDELRNRQGNPTGTNLSDDWQGSQEYFVPPSDGSTTDNNAYNVVHVEVVIWRG